MSSTWADLFRALGEAFSALLMSEASALKSDLAETRDALVKAVLTAIVAAFVLFWAVGAITVVIYEALSLAVDRWLAALIVLMLLLAIAAVLTNVAKRGFQRLESPVATVQRRLDDHVNWWKASVLEEPQPLNDSNQLAGKEEERHE